MLPLSRHSVNALVLSRIGAGERVWERWVCVTWDIEARHGQPLSSARVEERLRRLRNEATEACLRRRARGIGVSFVDASHMAGRIGDKAQRWRPHHLATASRGFDGRLFRIYKFQTTLVGQEGPRFVRAVANRAHSTK